MSGSAVPSIFNCWQDSELRSIKYCYHWEIKPFLHRSWTADGVALGAAAASSHTDVEMIVFFAIMLHKVSVKSP